MTARTKDTMRQSAWGLISALMLVYAVEAQGQGMTPTNASVQVSTISQTDPHPTTYQWDGDVPVIKEPGASYYAFYYIGTVTPDARVPEDSEIIRVPIKMNDWTANKRWIVAQLTMYYQQAHNLPATALQEYQAGPMAAVPLGAPPALGAQPGAAPGQAPGMPPAGQPGFNPPPPMPGPGPAPGGNPPPPMGNDEPVESMGGGGGGSVEQAENEEMTVPEPRDEDEMGGQPVGPNFGGGMNLANAFDPRVAAEWTFYYDQLVLWQFYCARQLLNRQEFLLERVPTSSAASQQQQGMLLTQVSGLTPQMLRSTTLQQSQRQATGRPGQPGMPNDMQQFQGSYMGGGGGGMGAGGENMEEMGMGGGGMGFGGMGGPGTQQQASLLRERFDPFKDYQSATTGGKTTGDEYREKFQEAAKQLDDQVYSQFITMIKGIDARQVGNENYEKWMTDKRKEVQNYADTWRNLDQGETMMIGEQMFIVSKEKLEAAPNDTVQVLKRERVTPADLLNKDGSVRQAEKK